jgi:hypothetical protein
MTEFITENLHYLLWLKQPANRERWRTTLAKWANCDEVRSAALIRGAFPTPDELRHLNSLTDDDEEKLRFTRLLKPDEILNRNIDYLFEGLDHGMKGEYARTLAVDLSTISRWRRGRVRPSRAHIRALANVFLLESGVNLEETPIFLSPVPVSLAQRRDWLKTQIASLSADDLTKLFPALRRLLGGADGID